MNQKLFLRTPKRKEVFTAKTKEKIKRKETREHLAQFNLACELVKVIRHFFPQLLPLLKQVEDPRHQSYVVYGNHVLLMTRILSSIFYISSMKKTSEEFNSETVIENIGILCGEQGLEELPYWETINDYLKRFSCDELQKVICQLFRSRKELDKRSLYSVHKKGTEKEYTEYYYYLLEAKIVLHEKIHVSIMTEFVENEGREVEKQDCERKAAERLMKRLKEEFPMLLVCLSGDSLYAYEGFFVDCREKKWKYILRYKEGSIPSIYGEYRTLREVERNAMAEGERHYDYVTEIGYRGESVNVAEYREECPKKKKEFLFITNLAVTAKNIKNLIERGR